jgi:hypothetical protein
MTKRGDRAHLIEATFRVHDGPKARWVQTWTRRVLRGGRRVCPTACTWT